MIPVSRKTMNVDFNNFMKGIIFVQDIIFLLFRIKLTNIHFNSVDEYHTPKKEVYVNLFEISYLFG